MQNDTRIWGVLAGFGAGAAAMYFLDPDRGARRRALVSSKVSSTTHQIPDAVRVTKEDLANRAQGLWHEAQHLFTSDDDAPDKVIEARVRSKLGRIVSHPHAVQVTSQNGDITLSGIILADEVPNLIKCAKAVPGVKSVENNLDEHDSPEGIPSLQGGTRREDRWEFFQENWSPAARFVAGTAGTAALAYGLAKRDTVGLGLGAVGAALLTRSATNTELQRLFGFGGGRRAVTVQKAINVNAPPDVLFGLWSNFENFPKFMSNVLEVKNTGEGLSHWKVAGPAGTPVEWDAQITKVEPNKMIAWKSIEGESVANAGYVIFEPNDDGSTEVTVRISYNPPAGAVGHAVAAVFGADPKSQMNEDLRRMRSMLETGEVSGDAARKKSGDLKSSTAH